MKKTTKTTSLESTQEQEPAQDTLNSPVMTNLESDPKPSPPSSIVTMTIGNETVSVPVKTTRELYMEAGRNDKKN